MNRSHSTSPKKKKEIEISEKEKARRKRSRENELFPLMRAAMNVTAFIGDPMECVLKKNLSRKLTLSVAVDSEPSSPNRFMQYKKIENRKVPKKMFTVAEQ